MARYFVYVEYAVEADSASEAWNLVESIASDAVNHRDVVGVTVQGAYGEDDDDFYVIEKELESDEKFFAGDFDEEVPIDDDEDDVSF